MPVFQCGFLAGGTPDPGVSKDAFRPVPTLVKTQAGSPTPERAIQGGWGFALATSDRWELVAWGVNQAAVLGRTGQNDDGSDPRRQDAIAAVPAPVASAAAGFDFLIAASDEGVFAIGPAYGPATAPLRLSISLPAGVAIASVSAGERHALLLDASGAVWALGSGREGQLGIGSDDRLADVVEPTRVGFPGSPVSDVPITVALLHGDSPRIVAVAAGGRHSAAVAASGRVYAWGWSAHGQTGGGASASDRGSVPVPTPVEGLPGGGEGDAAIAVSAGAAHTLVLTRSGSVFAFGKNEDGQLGVGHTVSPGAGPGDLRPAPSQGSPVLVDPAAFGFRPVSAISAGARHSLALVDGRPFAWGYGAFGQLGTGGHGSVTSPVPVAVPGAARVTAVAAGWWHSLFQVEP